MKKAYLFIILVILLTSCKKEEKLKTIEGNAFGSTYSIKYIGEKDYTKNIVEILTSFNNAVSTYQDSSDVISFNQAQKDFVVKGMFLELFKISQQINKKTMGYFDPSVAPLINLWGFGKDGKPTQQPTDSQIDSIKNFVGLDKITLTGNTLIKSNPNIQLNFNSITGYVNDKLAQFFQENNVQNYLIEIGGEVVAKGTKQDNKPWRIGLDNPLKKAEREVLIKFKLENAAFAPSGNYRKYYINSKGKKIVHIINPTTGYPEQSEILTAAIFANTCAEADGIATAVVAMGLEKAEKFLHLNKNISAVIIIAGHNEELEIKKYNGVEHFIID